MRSFNILVFETHLYNCEPSLIPLLIIIATTEGVITVPPATVERTRSSIQDRHDRHKQSLSHVNQLYNTLGLFADPSETEKIQSFNKNHFMLYNRTTIQPTSENVQPVSEQFHTNKTKNRNTTTSTKHCNDITIDGEYSNNEVIFQLHPHRNPTRNYILT